MDAVFVGWFREFTMSHLEAACHAVWSGAALYSASETPFFAAAGGRALGTSRAISAMIRSVTGCRLTVTGKPSLDALRAAATRLGVPARDLVVVGDDPLLEVPMAHRGRALAVAVADRPGRAGRLRPPAAREAAAPAPARRRRAACPCLDKRLSGANIMTEICERLASPSSATRRCCSIVTVPKPSPGPGQVLVKVAAATVNPTDLGFRQGGRPLPPGVEPPYIPGMDLAGVIDAIGPDVAGPWHRWRGDRVMAAVAPMVPGGGAQAEYGWWPRTSSPGCPTGGR